MYNPKVTACNPVKRAVREAMFEYNTQLLNKVALDKLDKLQGVCKELDIESCPKVKIIIADMEVTIQPSDTALKALLADVRKQVNDADKQASNGRSGCMVAVEPNKFKYTESMTRPQETTHRYPVDMPNPEETMSDAGPCIPRHEQRRDVTEANDSLAISNEMPIDDPDAPFKY